MINIQLTLAIINVALGVALRNPASLIVAAICILMALMTIWTERYYARRNDELDEAIAYAKTEYLRTLQVVEQRRRSEAAAGRLHVRSDGRVDVSKSNVFTLRGGKA